MFVSVIANSSWEPRVKAHRRVETGSAERVHMKLTEAFEAAQRIRRSTAEGSVWSVGTGTAEGGRWASTEADATSIWNGHDIHTLELSAVEEAVGSQIGHGRNRLPASWMTID